MRNSTIRHMPPTTRELARLINDSQSVNRRLKNFLLKIHALESLARANVIAEQVKTIQRRVVILPDVCAEHIPVISADNPGLTFTTKTFIWALLSEQRADVDQEVEAQLKHFKLS